jgi:orotidine-5'-phosphate decarboxylase
MSEMSKGKKKIIFAADVSSTQEAVSWAQIIGDEVGFFKFGKQLFTSEGPAVIKALQDEGVDVFLDLKYHDIPNTVAEAVVAAAKLGVKIINMHALGGGKMMRTAVDALKKAFPGPDRPELYAVTYLTSSDYQTMLETGLGSPTIDDPIMQEKCLKALVVKLAKLAQDSGVDGVIASPSDLPMINAACRPGFKKITPGVRPYDAAIDDQNKDRVMTPGEAVQNDATYLVVGRPISKAADPASAAKAIVKEVDEVLEQMAVQKNSMEVKDET